MLRVYGNRHRPRNRALARQDRAINPCQLRQLYVGRYRVERTQKSYPFRVWKCHVQLWHQRELGCRIDRYGKFGGNPNNFPNRLALLGSCDRHTRCERSRQGRGSGGVRPHGCASSRLPKRVRLPVANPRLRILSHGSAPCGSAPRHEIKPTTIANRICARLANANPPFIGGSANGKGK